MRPFEARRERAFGVVAVEIDCRIVQRNGGQGEVEPARDRRGAKGCAGGGRPAQLGEEVAERGRGDLRFAVELEAVEVERLAFERSLERRRGKREAHRRSAAGEERERRADRAVEGDRLAAPRKAARAGGGFGGGGPGEVHVDRTELRARAGQRVPIADGAVADEEPAERDLRCGGRRHRGVGRRQARLGGGDAGRHQAMAHQPVGTARGIDVQGDVRRDQPELGDLDAAEEERQELQLADQRIHLDEGLAAHCRSGCRSRHRAALP